MSSKAIIGGVIGATIGFFVAGPVGALKGAMYGFGAGAIYSMLKADGPAPGKPEMSEFDFTQAKEGLVVNDILGTTKCTGNIFFYGNNRNEEVTEEQEGGKGGESQNVVVGTEYFLTWAMGICLGPADVLYSVFREDECVWHGELERPASGGVETITLDGMGSMSFYFGTDDQTAPAALKALMDDSTLCPDYKGLVWAFFNDCSIGSYNRAPTIRFMLKKVPEFDFNADHEIEKYKYNPAHAIYYLLSNKTGFSTDYIDEDSFDYCAGILYAEALGVSILMNGQQTSLSYLEALISHIGGILRWNISGKFELALIREEKHTSRMLSVDQSMILDELELSRNSWTETLNDIKVQYPQIYIEEGECSEPAPVLRLVECDENTGRGTYSIAGGCPPFNVEWKISGASTWRFRKTVYSNTFIDFCSGINCGLVDSDRLIRVVDVQDQASNEITISNSAVSVLTWGGDRKLMNGESIEIAVVGGKAPYYFHFTQGTGLGCWFDGGYTKKTFLSNSPNITVWHDGNVCPPSARIEVDDDCDQSVAGNITGLSPPMQWGGDQNVDHNGFVTVLITGGTPPFTFSVTGSHLWLNPDYTLISLLTANRSVVVYSDGLGCVETDITITVTDYCGLSVQGIVTMAGPQTFAFDDDSTPDFIPGNDSIAIYTTGGVGPFTWEIEGLGYSLTHQTEGAGENILYLNTGGGNCGVDFAINCVITVTDACGQQIEFPIGYNGGAWSGCTSSYNGCGAVFGSQVTYAESQNLRMYQIEKWCTSTDACWDQAYIGGCTPYGYFSVGGCPYFYHVVLFIWECS